MPKEEINEKTAERLLLAAREARKNSYSPYSLYPVGAAVLAESGKVYAGCNMENVSYPASLCAERNAIGSAVAAGERKFLAIAVIGPKGKEPKDFCAPCGVCRQVIAEFKIPLIIAGRSEKDYRTFTLEGILPYAFEEDSLKKEQENP